ncbi:hypothetical protein [Leifsonia naganoensis]|uniref:Uncharacterized protein n=1 Tax=Leifsonia naganoensis TaxID=150025 RepID=A0A853DR66_9MICO|nr:hypothetical protein [Leifsonia naganoensis]NYK11566.1 hypothetical protein [Leifsonia naganoensis]
MSNPVQVDVFRFLAVRPPELVTEQETRGTHLRDRRLGDPDGERHIRSLARQVSTPGAAREVAAGRNPARSANLADLAQSCWNLIAHYRAAMQEEPGAEGPDATVRSALADAGIDELRDDDDVLLKTDDAWDAVYVAFASGADAGQRLEAPMAAVRLLSFLHTTTPDQRMGRDDALARLSAPVMVSPIFTDHLSHGRSSPTPAVGQEREEEEEEEEEAATAPSAEARLLAKNLAAAMSLLNAVTAAAPTEAIDRVSGQQAGPVAQQKDEGAGPDTVIEAAEWSTRLTMSTVPRVRDAVPAALTKSQVRVLDVLGVKKSTPAPAAASILADQVRALADASDAFVDDDGFRLLLENELRKYPGATSLVPLVPAPVAPKAAPSGPSGADVDMSGRIRPLGIGDLKVVKQQLISYVAGEVAHIENVLEGEAKKRTHRRLDRTEVTIFEADEETRESERDNQTTDRFELKSEASKTVKEDEELKAGVKVTGKYGPVEVTATGDFAHKSSKEESSKSSSNYAKEVVSKSVDKVQIKTRDERTTKTIIEIEEVNEHSLTNDDPAATNITGVYRWVDKKYRAQVYNYGVRLLVEVVVPEPAAYHLATKTAPAPKVIETPPPPFIRRYAENGVRVIGLGSTPLPPLEPGDITELNYLRYAGLFGVGDVEAPPPLYVDIGTSLATAEDIPNGRSLSLRGDDKFAIPDGYEAVFIGWAVSVTHVLYPRLAIHMQNYSWRVAVASAGTARGLDMGAESYTSEPTPVAPLATSGVIPIGLTGYDLNSVIATFRATCRRTPAKYQKWQIETYQKLLAGWDAKKKAYDQAVADATARTESAVQFEGQNPAANRITEAQELKKLCITMMTGEHFSRYGAVTDGTPPEIDPVLALQDGRIAQFFEQAFEWEQMTYLFYPYFWGRKKRWSSVQFITDPDPLFQRFLTAGAARVLLPVPLAYADAVLYLLKNPLGATDLSQKVWQGGPLPTLDDDTYRSIADEVRDQTDDLAGAKPEGEPWEFKLPTTLVWLQPDGTLPTDFD